ncbi:hypothetical protein C479_12843 [Halovivax asiaticus JCM 14624]|uniref:Uncharacterized protein n=2 Tax=Halovivax asiaticus TaxID=332953 RepID=M0BD48_9EURY|nr:hypothetical protein C479_12843 [Halovivax asiaticus JCM 14624]
MWLATELSRMKLRQNARHFASRKALETPVVREVARRGLIRLHTRVFLGKADPDHAEARRDRLDALFDATVDTYLAALQNGFSEAEAREITHLQANFDFYNHGWTEMMEIPVDELDVHYDRYADAFESWGISIDDPLGEFATKPLPDAPSTPERLDDPEHPHAADGFADDVYVEGDDGELTVGGRTPSEPVSVTDAVGVDERATSTDGTVDQVPSGDEPSTN